MTDAGEKLASRCGEAVASRILAALANEGLAGRLRFLKDGMSASVFAIEGSGLVMKVSDTRLQKNPPMSAGRFTLDALAQATLADDVLTDDKGKAAQTVVEFLPALTHEGVTVQHQEMLRYKMWVDEGRDFWDHLPAASNPKEVKNVMLDTRGVPYQVDADAVRVFDDRWNEYPADADGRRRDEQYLKYRADSWDAHGRPDAIPAEKFRQIKEACAKCDWPAKQDAVFAGTVDAEALAACRRAAAEMQPQRVMARR